MKSIFFVSLLFTCLVGCEAFGGGLAKNYDKEYTPTTGKFCFVDENHQATDSYFIFDGTKNVMSFEYFEEGNKKLSGTFRFVVPSEKGKDRTYCFSYCLDKKDGEKEDVLTCYSDNFSDDDTFTQFTIMQEEKKFTNSDKKVDFHTYRLSELPYKMGTYVKEGSSYVEEKDEYKYADIYFIPSGTYALSDSVSFTSFYTKKRTAALFSYRNGDQVVEGVYNVGVDKDKIFLYIQHDIYQKVTKEDKEKYDTTFSAYYPPDVGLHGSFDVNKQQQSVTVSEVIFTANAPTYPDNFWQAGTYNKI